MTAADERYMRRALELAALGSGFTRPNPMVGCVVVHEKRIIGEGWHRRYGGPHAEVNAIAAVEDKSLLPQSRVYVTLEPCAHFGKTPPCADLLVQHGVQDVVICNTDPNPLVAGKGIQRLLNAGAKVHTGLLEQEGLELNRRFFTFHTQKRPYIILKWAETADGFIAKAGYGQAGISSELSRKLVHKWRTEEAAIMVGTRTALHDNPQLNTRFWTGPSPIRIVADRHLTLPSHLRLFDRSQPTLVYNLHKDQDEENLLHVKLAPEQEMLPQLLQDLHRRNIQSVLVEGGAVLLELFLRNNLWDEARVFRSSGSFGEGIAAPLMPLAHLLQATTLGTDQLLHFRNSK